MMRFAGAERFPACQRSVRDIALVLIEFARREHAARRNQRPVQSRCAVDLPILSKTKPELGGLLVLDLVAASLHCDTERGGR